jgi:hypothetical protein
MSLAELLSRLPRWAAPPGLLEFGKFKGKTFQHVYENEDEYVMWVACHLDGKRNLTANQEAFVSFIRQQAQQELDRNKGPQGDEADAEGSEDEPKLCKSCGAPLEKSK